MNKAVIENKSAVTIHGLKPGASMPLKVDSEGTPLDRSWRRRVADSKVDGAVMIKKPAGHKATAEKKKE